MTLGVEAIGSVPITSHLQMTTSGIHCWRPGAPLLVSVTTFGVGHYFGFGATFTEQTLSPDPVD